MRLGASATLRRSDAREGRCERRSHAGLLMGAVLLGLGERARRGGVYDVSLKRGGRSTGSIRLVLKGGACVVHLPRDRRARDRRALNRRAESSFVPETASDPASDPTLSGARQIDNPTCSTLLQCNSDVTRPRRPTLRQLNFLPVAKRGTSPFQSPTLSGARQIDNPTFR
jgi:hypothetical protein